VPRAGWTDSRLAYIEKSVAATGVACCSHRGQHDHDPAATVREPRLMREGCEGLAGIGSTDDLQKRRRDHGQGTNVQATTER
jgi:hypothetical protein